MGLFPISNKSLTTKIPLVPIIAGSILHFGGKLFLQRRPTDFFSLACSARFSGGDDGGAGRGDKGKCEVGTRK